MEQITIAIVLYLKLIKATYVQVCWLFGANFSPTSSFLSSPSNFRAAGLLLKTEGKGWSRSQLYFIWNLSKLLMFKFVGYLVTTFLQSPVFLSSSQILERLAFYWKRRRRAAAVYDCDLFEILQSYSRYRLLVFDGNFSPILICCSKDKRIWLFLFFFCNGGK